MLTDEWSNRQGGRYVLWMDVAPVLLKQYPQGMGLKATRHEDLTRISPRVQPNLDHLHNNVIQVRLELGWAGLLAWLWWMATAFFVMLFSISSSVNPTAIFDAIFAIGYPVAFEARAEERETLGFTSITLYSPFSGFTANRESEPP
jgi:hypothetical protein